MQCDSFLPVMPLSRYLCRIPDVIRGRWTRVKPVNMDVGIREFSPALYMLRITATLRTHLFSDITAV